MCCSNASARAWKEAEWRGRCSSCSTSGGSPASNSSVSLSLGKLIQYGHRYEVTFVATGLQPALRGAFERLAAGEHSGIFIFADLDHGLEYCEDQMLATALGTAAPDEETLEQQLRAAGGGDSEIEALMCYAERRWYPKGQSLIQQGEMSRDLFYIERGSVTAILILPDGQHVRLRTMGAGTVVGEIAAYLQRPRSASVVADDETLRGAADRRRACGDAGA